MSEEQIPSELHEQYPFSDEPEPDTLAYQVASWVMQEFDPGFVIIGSPNIGVTDSGVPYPDSIGIVINSGTAITKTSLAEILKVLITHLNGDMDKITHFLTEATGE